VGPASATIGQDTDSSVKGKGGCLIQDVGHDIFSLSYPRLVAEIHLKRKEPGFPPPRE